MKSESKKIRDQQMSQKRLQYIERMGIFFEREGLPRMAGRVFALLLTGNGEHVFCDIVFVPLLLQRMLRRTGAYKRIGLFCPSMTAA